MTNKPIAYTDPMFTHMYLDRIEVIMYIFSTPTRAKVEGTINYTWILIIISGYIKPLITMLGPIFDV